VLLGEAEHAIAPLEDALELARESRVGLEQQSLQLALLSEAKLAAGDRHSALQSAQQATATGERQGVNIYLPHAYVALAEALLAGEDANDMTAAQEALQNATAAVQATGAHAELPFIERTREKLRSVHR
jgi:hypothetical protein